MTYLNKQRRKFHTSISELSADAPIAAIDCDGSSNDSRCNHLDFTGARIFSEEHLGGSFCSLDFEAPLHGSLTDLVLNFEDRIRSTEHVNKGRNISLRQIKMWWTEADGDISVSDYPLADVPDKIGPYDELEPMDADGMTEDSNLGPIDLSIENRLHCCVLNSTASSHGHVTTDSESLSPVSPQVSTAASTYHSEMLPLSNQNLYVPQSLLDTPDSSLATIAQSTDLMRFSIKRLRLHIDGLSSSILLKSDQLVQLLTERDEQLMLREASDDFVILLCFVHQRRARASRAALKNTAWSMVRPKVGSRARIPWLSRRLWTDSLAKHADSPNAVQDPGATFQRDRSLATESDDYLKSLHLDSKRRLPASHPIALRASRSSSHDPEPRSSRGTTDSPLTAPSSWQPASDSAKMRLVELRNRCASMGWPNNRPELSLALALHLPFNSGYGRMLSKLRIINQILYGALLELPDTRYLIERYWDEIYRSEETSSWVTQSSCALTGKFSTIQIVQ